MYHTSKKFLITDSRNSIVGICHFVIFRREWYYLYITLNSKQLFKSNINISDSLSDDMSQTREPQYLPGAPVVIETIENRLSPKVPEETLSYGPMPPSSSGR